MFSLKKSLCVFMAFCLAFSLAVQATAFAPHIESVKKTADGRYTVDGRIDGYDGASFGQLYAATYDESGRMTDVDSVATDGSGAWSYTGGDASGGIDVLKAYAVSDAENGLRPQGENDCAIVVSTMEELAEALSDGACDNIFIAQDMTLDTEQAEKTIAINKTVTVSKGVTLTVPEGYTLQLDSGASLTVAGTLGISAGALAAVAGSYTHRDGENIERIAAAQLVLNGGTVNVAGTLRLWPAGTDLTENYDGGTGGIVTGRGSEGSVAVATTGRVEICGGSEGSGVYNNPGRMTVSGYVLTLSGGGTLTNDNELVVLEDGEIAGDGSIVNHYRMRIEGGHISGTLDIDNEREIQAITAYLDDGLGGVTVNPAVIGGGVVIDDNNGSGWIYEAAQVQTKAALDAALDGYEGSDIEFAGGETLTVGSFDVPSGMRLCVFLPLNLTAEGEINVYGTLETHNTFSIPSGGSLTVEQSGTLEVQGSGEQGLSNAGTMTVDGILEVGVQDENQGYLYNGETGAITVTGSLEVIPGSELKNDGTITGVVTLVSNGENTGLLTGTGTGTSRTAIAVSSYEEMASAMSNPAYDVLRVRDGFEISSDIEVTKELAVPENSWLRVMDGATLTLRADALIAGWVENRGTIDVGSGSTICLLGRLYNNGGDPRGTVSVSGAIDINPGGMLKNHGGITIPGVGEIRIGGILAWGSEDDMPVAGTTSGYSTYDGGSIVSTSRTASDWSSFNAFLDDESCDNIVLGFDMTVSEDTVFRKSVSIPYGRKLTVNESVTLTLDGAQLNIEYGGELDNGGTVVIANENGNPGRLWIAGGAVLDTSSGAIEVYGELQFNDYGSTEIYGEENITYHYYAELAYLAKTLAPLLSSGYGYDAGNAGDYAGYADWGNLDEDSAQNVAFILVNMSDPSILEKTYEGDENTYLEPYRSLGYSEILEILGQLWAKLKSPEAMPASVCLEGKADDDLVCTYDYGSGSEFGLLCDAYMQELGNIVVSSAATFTVNGGAEEQSVAYRTFQQAVTVVWDTESAYQTNNIYFEGCEFERGLTIVNSGMQYRGTLDICSLSPVDEKPCDFFVEPQYVSEEPVFDVTDNSREIVIGLRGTTSGSGSGGKVTVNVDNCSSHVEDYIEGSSFILNGATYYGASYLGSGGCFVGKYQIDASDGGTTASFHAGEYTSTVIAGNVNFLDFHVWDNIKNNVTLTMIEAFTSGGNLNISDDYLGDDYGVVVTGEIGDSTNTNRLDMYLRGKVDISGLTAYYTNGMADSDAAVRFASNEAWVFPTIVGDYKNAAIRLGDGNLEAQGYTFTLYKKMWDEYGNEYMGMPEDISVHYEESSDETFLWGLPDTDELQLEVTRGGKTVYWVNMYRAYDAATCADFAEALYAKYGSDTVHFTPAANAVSFVTGNELMTDTSDRYVTMLDAVTALEAVAGRLDVTFNNYYPGGALARVDYQNGVSYGEAFENDLLTMASALAFGSLINPYYTWDDDAGTNVLAIGFNGDQTIGKSTYDANGVSEVSALIEAFETACAGGIFIGNSPEIQGATFAGAVTMTQGRNMGSNVQFRDCVFTDDGGVGQALDISMDNGVNIVFDNCIFSGATEGFAVNLSPVTADRLNTQGANLSNIPGGAKINTTKVRVQVDCGESEGSFFMNGAEITALDFDNYDGGGSSFDGHFVAAGIWWDDPEKNPSPTLGFSGGVARVDVPDTCATKFCAFNAGDDCPCDITLDIAAGWTPDYDNWLSLRSWSEQTLYVTGTVTGGLGIESDPDFTYLVVELIGNTDVTGASFTGNHYIVTGKWIDLNRSHTVGNKSIHVLYDGDDSGRYIGIGIGNIDGATDSAAVVYHALGAENHVTINGLGGISLTEDGNVCIGDLTGTDGNFAAGYTLTLYELQSDTWTTVSYDLDTTDSSNYMLVPTTPLTAPYNVRLSVTDTGASPSITFNVLWEISEEESGERSVSTAAELADALQDEDVYRIYIADDISLDVREGESESTYTFGKEVDINEGVTLAVAENVTLEVNDGLVVNGTLSVAGTVYVRGWMDDKGDWDAHIVTTGGGQVYTYIDYQSFAIDLYNSYSMDYGLTDTAAAGAYESCYTADYYGDSGAADGMKAINFLIENGVIDAGATGLNGWVKLSYAGAMELLDGLAAAMEASLSLTAGTITGYGLDGVADDDWLSVNIEPSPYQTLIDSFVEAVGEISLTESVIYEPGIYNSRMSYTKNYAFDVTVNCIDGEDSFFLFAGCTFGGDLTINAGASDKILLIGCQVNGNLSVLDDDGHTDVYFLETTFGTPLTSTVTVTEKTENGAADSARLDTSCDSVILYYLPAGISVVSDKVSAAVVNQNTTGDITINGVEVTGEPYVEGDESYYVAAFTCWQEVETGEGTAEIPVLVVTGRTAEIDASNDQTNEGDGFAKFWLYENAGSGLSASDTVLIPKAGSAVNIANSANARFQVSFDGGTTAIDPVIRFDGGDYRIEVPDVEGISYEIDTGSGYLPYEPSGGVITLPTGVDYDTTDVAMKITQNGSNTAVGIDALAKDIVYDAETVNAVFTKVTAYDETERTLTFYNDVTVDFSSAEGYEDLSVGDYVSYAIFGGVYSIEKATAIRNQITSKNSADPVRITTVEGTQYFPSGETNASDLTTYDNDIAVNMQFLHNYTFYLDPFGDIIALDESQTTVTAYTRLLLLSAEESGGVYTVSTSLFPSEAYTLNADDPLTLQAFAACDNDSDADSPVLVRCTITESVLTVSEMAVPFTASITKGVTQIGVDGDGPVNAGNSTSFYYFSTGVGEYDSYHGIDETPTVGEIPTDAYYLPGSDGNASAVLVITEDTIPPLGGPVVGEGCVYIDNVGSYSYSTSGGYTCYTYDVYDLGGGSTNIDVASPIAAAGFYSYVAYTGGLCELTRCEATADGGNEFSGTLTEFDTANNRMYIDSDFCDLTDDTIVYCDDGGMYWPVEDGGAVLNAGDAVCAYVDSQNEAVIIFITTDT